MLCCAVAVCLPCLCRLDEYAKRGSEPDSELQIYTWPDATLRELTELIKDVRKDACNRWGWGCWHGMMLCRTVWCTHGISQ